MLVGVNEKLLSRTSTRSTAVAIDRREDKVAKDFFEFLGALKERNFQDLL